MRCTPSAPTLSTWPGGTRTACSRQAQPACPACPARGPALAPDPGSCPDPRGGHGRAERRTLKVTAVAAGLAFPHAAQAIQIARRRQVGGKKKRSAETCYAVTSLTVTQASAAELAAIIRATGLLRTASTGSATWTGTRTCDTRLHVASECADWRADDVGGVAPGQCSRPVPALTCVAGNCGVRSSGKKPKRVPFHPGAQARGRPDGRT